MANELQAADTALFAALTESSGVTALVSTRVYAGAAPQGATLPYVLFQHSGGRDRQAVGGDRVVFSRPVYQVRAVADGEGFGAADAIADAVDTVLNGLERTVTVRSTNYRVLGCHREEPVRHVELEEGRRAHHAGGLYRLYIQQLP